MNTATEFLSLSDKPALIALSSPSWQEVGRAALNELGYKVHQAAAHGDFISTFMQVAYQVVLIEDLFASNSFEENRSLAFLQTMPSAARRHATIILVGENFTSFSPMQAYQQSVHLVLNPSEISFLLQVIQKTVAENDVLLQPYREAQRRQMTAKQAA